MGVLTSLTRARPGPGGGRGGDGRRFLRDSFLKRYGVFAGRLPIAPLYDSTTTIKVPYKSNGNVKVRTDRHSHRLAGE